MNMENYYLTKDLYLAGFLYAKGIEFGGVKRQGSLCWFVFVDKPICESLQLQFFAKSTEVNAKDYADSLRTLKNLIYSQQ